MTEPGKRVLRVVVASHREIVARGVAAVLADHPDRVLVTASAGMRSVDPSVDVVLYDLALLDVSGVQPLDELVRRVDGRVLALAGHADGALELVAEEHGVAGCVGADVHGEELVRAVVATAAGQRPRRPVPTSTLLSAREKEVLALIVQGLSNVEVAEKLFISPNTLKSHIRQAYRKIGATTRAQAVAWVAAHGLG
jgi:DNA-binding NarL/FixJ family response regulator